MKKKHSNERTSYDFGGWATKYGLKCTDGRVILPGAFSHMNGSKVPLVWQHGHNDVNNVLGHVILEERPEGLYCFGYFNDGGPAKQAKSALNHGDINALSIYANGLTEANKKVSKGAIREASLVLSGANPGALIDYIAFEHSDGSISLSDEEAVIYSGLALDNIEEADKVLQHEDVEDSEDDADSDEETAQEVFDTLNSKQKELVYAMMAQAVLSEEDSNDSIKQSNIEEGEKVMKKNVFDQEVDDGTDVIELDFDAIKHDAMLGGNTMKSAFNEALKHAGTYGIGSDRTNLGLLFPDAQSATNEPTFISRRMEWVAAVLNKTRHAPFSRIRSLHADITADAARAKGYVTGAQKFEEVFPVLRRITTPTTVYKKQKLDRDDVTDITDFNVVAWLKKEMRIMLDEELARAILIADGRNPLTDPDKIDAECIRPIYGDNPLYVHYQEAAADDTVDEMIDGIIAAQLYYRGSGNPVCFMAPSLLTTLLLLRDLDGRRLYRTSAELAMELGVSEIISVPVMENITRTKGTEGSTYTAALKAIIVNLTDYTIGADKGGEVSLFDDFDINYNQLLYLIETRMSGALVVPKSAIVFEQRQA